MRKIKIIFILSILFAIYFFVCAYTYVSAISDNLYNSVFRLHVIANSDSQDDQNLKYLVRDNLIEYINNNTSSFKNKQDVINYSISHLDEIRSIAENTIKSNGYNYPVSVDIGNFEFPTKVYGDISFPAGFYDALKVKIGSSKGKNWWCVMFPPLCFVSPTDGVVSEESKQKLNENLSNENYNLISESDSSFVLKFKIIELFERSGLITAKN